jgi:NACalpha-BTF3-like transcription factor
MADTRQDAGRGQHMKEQEHAQLDKVTDNVEQRELQGADTSKIQQAMSKLAAQQQAAKQEALKIERELASVKVEEDHVRIIKNQFDMHQRQAERALKECKGDLKATIEHLISS